MQIWIRLVKRILAGIIMVLAVASFTFFLVRLMPGNPVEAKYNELIMRGMTPVQAMDQVRVMYGFIPHQPLWQQYVLYLNQIIHLNLGRSISYEGIPVLHIILGAAPWTIILVLTGLIASFIVGVLAGVIAAIKRSSPVGNALSLSGSILHGIPQFVMGLFLAYVFTTLWAILPFGAPYNAALTPGFNWPFISSLVRHAILPVATYALSSYGGWLLTMKSSVITVLGDDFILASEVRGLKMSTQVKYIAHNAILPLFTVFALSIGFMFGGSLFIEDIFDYPGLGNLLLHAINARDYPLMSGAFLLITVAVIISNIFADFLYSVVDPRIRR
ncbi:peptide/nickel transport system permease protein [Sulfobacillus thermosulfidooxidans DSM 9293]|uniref:Peptide/nickel transport system permease protein n=1 Tax=Sulfobacillus thermosulfidooxidans (strain DSM 9293 / VKM B-1269 / AT-1) TaxID=929705 RepID=A0A1W1WDT7_SULTA|nr:ABC transporter permease [Sulfobacillus thermosulfidooxidans]SMC04447.1 peptide/nickel transport system permease protein [Sulfobacillus thermosulfidooxidans DSM 9293]